MSIYFSVLFLQWTIKMVHQNTDWVENRNIYDNDMSSIMIMLKMDIIRLTSEK